MKYIITEEDKNLLLAADEKLSLVEIKGDNLIHLALARMFLKQLFESMKEVKENTEGGT